VLMLRPAAFQGQVGRNPNFPVRVCIENAVKPRIAKFPFGSQNRT
jgi:hypothetical protein